MKWSSVLLITGLLLAPLGIVAIINNQPYARTFSFTIPPGEYHYQPIRLNNGELLSGDFTENQNQPINFYVFNQQQYDGYKVTGVSVSLLSMSNVPSGTYTISIPAAGTYYLVTAHGTGYDQTSEQMSLRVRIDGTNLPYTGLESLAPIGVALLVASYPLGKRENRRLVSSLLKDNPNFGPGQGEVDGQILNIAKDLCRDMGFVYEPLAIYYVVWVKFGGIRIAPSDECLLGVKGERRGYVYLPAVLRGRLDPNEWKPLIASSLIYSFQPGLKHRRLVIQRSWLLTLAAVIAVTTVVLWFFNDVLVPVLAIPAVVLLIMLVARKINMTLRKYFLDADTIAADVAGKDLMIQTLKKIDSMRLVDIEERKQEKPTIWRRAGVLPWPSITNRIQQLEK